MQFSTDVSDTQALKSICNTVKMVCAGEEEKEQHSEPKAFLHKHCATLTLLLNDAGRDWSHLSLCTR